MSVRKGHQKQGEKGDSWNREGVLKFPWSGLDLGENSLGEENRVVALCCPPDCSHWWSSHSCHWAPPQVLWRAFGASWWGKCLLGPIPVETQVSSCSLLTWKPRVVVNVWLEALELRKVKVSQNESGQGRYRASTKHLPGSKTRLPPENGHCLRSLTVYTPHFSNSLSPKASSQNDLKYFSLVFFFFVFPSPFLLCFFWQCGGHTKLRAVEVLPSVPEFLPNSLIILALHDEHPIHFISKYVTGIGNVHSSLCREGGSQATFWLGQGLYKSVYIHRHYRWAAEPVCPHLPWL